MKKIISILVASSIIVGCNDNHDQQVYQQPQRIEQVYIQPPVQITQPVQITPQPVIINQQPQSNGVASFATGAVVGAVAGHLLTKESSKPEVIEPKINHMDTAKLSKVETIAKPVTKTSGMDMNIMAQSSAPAKPVSKMNMSKLGKH
jgi:hypothetical protein